MKVLKRKILVSFLLILLLGLFGCTIEARYKSEFSQLDATSIEHELKFGGAYIHITIEDFNKLGFEYGDSVDVYFSSGFELIDLPYYNGYYVDTGDPLLVAYPGYPYIKTCYNNGDDMFIVGGLSEDDTAVITIHEKAKYLNMQEAMDIHYSDEQGTQSDEVFANFRVVNVGNLRPNILYRSASPCDNQHQRAGVSDRLAEAAGIRCIMNLSDNEEELIEHINGFDFDSPYFLSLYQENLVIPLSMSMAYKTEVFSEKLLSGLAFIASHDGPYLVHCVEGKDRTGFVCIILEALAGASYDELVADYMETYDNYYGVNLIDQYEKYMIIKHKNFDPMIDYLFGGEVGLDNYQSLVEEFLLGIGMSEEVLISLENKLCADCSY